MNQGPIWGWFMKKNRHQKSHTTVPLKLRPRLKLRRISSARLPDIQIILKTFNFTHTFPCICIAHKGNNFNIFFQDFQEPAISQYSYSLTGPVGQPFASRHEGPGFKPQGGTYVKPGFFY